MAAEAANRLQEVFPNTDRGLLLDVLHQHNNDIEDAITSLLQLTKEPTDKTARRRASPAKAARAGRASSGQSWGALGLSADLQSKLRLAPTFSPGRGTSAAPQPHSTQDFPAALPTHQPRSQANTSNEKRGISRSQHSSGNAGWPPAWQAGPSGPSGTLQAAQRQQRRHKEEQWQQEAAEQLALQWPWAGRELVWSVLSSVGFDLDTAQAILADMAAGQGATSPAGPAGPAATAGRAGSTTSGCAASGGAESEVARAGEQRGTTSEDDDWDSGNEEEASPSQLGLSRAEVDDDFVLPGVLHSKKPRGPAAAAAGGGAGGAAGAGAGGAAGAGRPHSQLQQRPTPAPVPSEPSRADPLARPGAAPVAVPLAAGEGTVGEWHPAGDSDESSDDLYYKYRGEALRLTRDWQKMVKKAAAAYSSANHSKARLLAAEAQRLRLESLAAHESAAARIEAEMNAGNSLFQLDLHGLHATEAVAALDRRLELLQSVLQDAALQAQPSQRGGRGGAAAAAQQQQGPLRPAGSAALGVLPAGGRWELRVVVGRGAHSSGGEASIPRAVEGRLAALGYRFERRTGALDVQLRRAAGLRAAAAALPAQQR